MSHALTVYLRTGCHLCEDMLLQLHELQTVLDLELELIDIAGNPSLEQKYGEKIPALTGNGQEICHYFLDQVALQRYIEHQ